MTRKQFYHEMIDFAFATYEDLTDRLAFIQATLEVTKDLDTFTEEHN